MARLDLTTASNVFKTVYGKLTERVYNTAHVLHSLKTVKTDFVGKELVDAVPMTFGGSVGADVLPVSNVQDVQQCKITASKKLYGRVDIDRQAIYRASQSVGSFVKTTKWKVQTVVESFTRWSAATDYGTHWGIRVRSGDGSTNVTKTGTTIFITFREQGWNQAQVEERDYMNYITGLNAGDDGGGTNDTDGLYEVVSVDPSTRRVGFRHVSGTDDLSALAGSPLPTTSGFCMQNSYGKEPIGLTEVLNFSKAKTGSLYGIPWGRRWSMEVLDAKSAGFTVDMLNEVFLKIAKKFGNRLPGVILMSHNQFQNALALFESRRRFTVMPRRNATDKGVMGFNAIEYLVPGGNGRVALMTDRFVDDDKIWLLNTSWFATHRVPGFGWFDDDGTVLLRNATSDAYEARYGGYWENKIIPPAHGCIENLG